MNKAILLGRLTRDPELANVGANIPKCTFTLAIDRRFKSASGERQTDFIPVVAWRQQAEFASKYFRKGSRMLVVGSIQVRSWDDNEGKKRYATEVVADEINFVDTKREDAAIQQSPASAPPAGRMDEPDGFFPAPDDDTALPFDLG